jgi:hypothetical protein
LQIKDFQVFGLMGVRDFQLAEPTGQQIKGRMHSPDQTLWPSTFEMRPIDEQDATQTATHQPGGNGPRYRQLFL